MKRDVRSSMSAIMICVGIAALLLFVWSPTMHEQEHVLHLTRFIIGEAGAA